MKKFYFFNNRFRRFLHSAIERHISEFVFPLKIPAILYHSCWNKLDLQMIRKCLFEWQQRGILFEFLFKLIKSNLADSFYNNCFTLSE